MKPGTEARHLQRDQSYDAPPSESNSAEIEQTVIKPIGAAFDAIEDSSIVVGKPRRNGFSALLGFLAECTAET